MKYYFYTFKNPMGRRASVREFITRQTCKICDYTVDYMCRTKTSKSPQSIKVIFHCSWAVHLEKNISFKESIHNCNCSFPWFNLSLLIICCLWQLPTSLSPLNSRVNFACPNENILRGINPLGSGFPSRFSPGLIDSMIELKIQHPSLKV
jgi:hypothetical protein